MEEVDSIILHFLKQLNIEFDESTKNICDLPVEVIVESVSKCLYTINPSLKIPLKLPPGISQRIEVAAQIASLCKDLGYKNDVGYQTFLYYNEAELRQVFMFLIERLPNENKQTDGTKGVTLSKKSLLDQNISCKINEELNAIWIPPCCNSNSNNQAGDFINPSVISKSTSTSTLNENEIVQKLLKIKHRSTSTSDVPSGSCQKSEDVKSETQPKCHEKYADKSLKELKETTIILRQKLDALESEKNVMEIEYSQMKKRNEKAEAELNNIVEILNSLGIDIESVDKIDIFEELQKSINMLHVKNDELTSKNLSLKVEMDKFMKNKNISESERSRCKKVLINLKDTAKSLKAEYEEKEELKQKLIKHYEKIRTGNRRSTYTKRILEIISNVDKQNMEIKKILDDTRELQKEINVLEGQLERCFTIADETLFKDAKKDDQAKKAYKLLALLHSECNTIVSLVNDTGIINREIIDLEDSVEFEKSKRTEETLSKVLQDLTRMQEESKDKGS